MRKSVNGKSFDEIFEQRGKQMKIGRFSVGKIYLYEFWADRAKKCLFRFDGKNSNKSIFTHCALVFYSGDRIKFLAEKTFIGMFNRGAFIYATPDQIDLLNAYEKD